MMICIRVWVGGQGVGIILLFFFFLFVLLSFGLLCPVSLLGVYSMIAVVSISLLLFAFFISGPFN